LICSPFGRVVWKLNIPPRHRCPVISNCEETTHKAEAGVSLREREIDNDTFSSGNEFMHSVPHGFCYGDPTAHGFGMDHEELLRRKFYRPKSACEIDNDYLSRGGHGGGFLKTRAASKATTLPGSFGAICQ